MKKIIFSLIILLLFSGIKAENVTKNGIVSGGKEVRFTVLTPRMIRMEWDSTGQFTDRPSFVMADRQSVSGDFKVNRRGKYLVINTGVLELRYLLNSGKFTKENLTIKELGEKKGGFLWYPGMQQKANLKGTSRTLDGVDGDMHHGHKLELENGLLARDGWTLIDDSGSFLFDDSPWPWVVRRSNPAAQDWYFMGYGKDYKAALSDYARVAGKVPLPPKYAFGYWWSRYWSYSDKELRELVGNFEKYNIPLDVLVIDMDWHYTEPGKGGWTGWTWNRRLFPDPGKFLAWTNEKGLKTTLNLHPADGIAPFEAPYPEFARRMNLDTNKRQAIPFEGSNKQFIQNLFDVVLNPMTEMGIDFWWLDWQQWLHDKKVEGLSNTWWINYVFFSYMQNHSDKRPLLYHRWGGLGNHRYQIGFSGDTYISWASLEYQPYFTNTASNVLYGYWSHDIGGHMYNGKPVPLDPEMYTRWMQYGALSPMFRTHSGKFTTINKEIWNFQGKYFDAQREAIHLRYALFPYIYTMARKTFDEGISLCRPMYYDYPEKEEAYAFDRQYQFGDDLLIAPIGQPMKDGFSTVKVWLPEGTDWYEWHTGTLLKGGQITERKFAIDEYPIYIKAGTILPMYPQVKNLSEIPKRVVLTVFPGTEAQGRMYEDQGDDQEYDKHYAYTTFRTEYPNNNMWRMTIFPVKGKYGGMPESRGYEVKIVASRMPEKVIVDGKAATWKYVGKELSLNIDVPEAPVSHSRKIEVVYPEASPAGLTNGLVGKFKRLTEATTALKYENAMIVLPAGIGVPEETSMALEYFPERFGELIENFNVQYPQLPEVIKTMDLKEETKARFLKNIGF